MRNISTSPILATSKTLVFSRLAAIAPFARPHLLGPVSFPPNGVELKAERRKPSGEKHCDIEDIPSLTGVLAHFRFH